MKALLSVILLLFSHPILAQVEHNFEMGPKNTDCHSLPTIFESPEQAISAVESSKFRFQQTIKISRIRSPRSAIFYSCDGEKGYLVATEDEETKVVYPDIPMTIWNDFINTDNPIEFYTTRIKGQYSVID